MNSFVPFVRDSAADRFAGPALVHTLIAGLIIGHSSVATGDPAAETREYRGPCALAVSPGADMLYVACTDTREVAWVELPGGAVLRRVAVPAEPTDVLLTNDGSQLIVVCAAPASTVVLLDAAAGRLLRAIPAGHTASAAALHPDGRRLYVCNRFHHDVTVIDLSSGREVARVPAVREPIAAAVTPDGAAVLVANHLPNTRTDDAFRGNVSPLVTLIDTRTLETAGIELPHGANGLRGLCVSPDGRHALVTHLLSNFQMVPFRVDNGWINVNVVSILDIQQRKVIATIGVDEYDRGAGNPWDVIWTADGRTVCVSAAGTHELCVIASDDLLGSFAARTMQPMMAVWPIYPSLGDSLWRRIELPGKGPRGLAAAGSTVYVAQYFSDSVAVVERPPAGERAGERGNRYFRDNQAVTDGHAAGQNPVPTIALGPPPRLTPERYGELLFHDATLCYQHWQSCASCHPDGRADALNWDLMNDGVGNLKNTKSMLLAHETPPAMAEGVRISAEVAVRSGMANILFTPQPAEEQATAIDAYLRALQPVPSPYLAGGAWSAAAERGRELFHSQRIACHRCHPAPLYTDLRSHNVGSRSPQERTERFDTPTLVEVWRTAPYLHDGRYPTLQELFGEGRHGLTDGRLEGLSDQDLRDLIEFVLSL